MKKYIFGLLISGFVLLPFVSSAQTTDEIIAAFRAQIVALTEQLRQLQATKVNPGQGCYTFNTNLRVGDNGSEISALIRTLGRGGFLDAETAGVSGVSANSGLSFDEKIAAAVTGFQEKYRDEILTPNGLKYGTGFVGPSTRKKLNQLYGCGVTPPYPYPTPMPPYPTPFPTPINSQAPVISGIKGPTALNVGEAGMWTINAYDPESGSLSYSVIWGDENMNPVPPPQPMASAPIQQTTVFTHLYAKEGVYTPVFYVTDNQGLSAKTSISVKVGNAQINRGSLYLSPYNLSVGVGKSAEIQALYQPSMPPCSTTTEGACWQYDPVPYPVSVQWVSSNTQIVTVTPNICETTSGTCGNLLYDKYAASVRGISAGNTEIKAVYTDSSGNLLTAVAHVSVTSVSQPSITVISPNGGEQWQIGSTQAITWRTVNSPTTCPSGAYCAQMAPQPVTISLYQYTAPCTTTPCPMSPTFLYSIARNAFDSGSYGWVVGKNLDGVNISDGRYIIQISNSSQSDQSDAPFSIVSTNNSRPQPPFNVRVVEAIIIDGSAKIYWDNVNGDKFYIYKNKNDGAFQFLGVTSEKFYKDTTGLSKDIQYGYYVTALNAYGESDPSSKVYAGPISTTPSITVLSPNGGETWLVGSQQKITWTPAPIPTPTSCQLGTSCPVMASQTVDIYLVLESPACPPGATCALYYPMPTLIAQGVLDNYPFYWTVKAAADKYRIKVVRGNASDQSNASFGIVAATPL